VSRSGIAGGRDRRLEMIAPQWMVKGQAPAGAPADQAGPGRRTRRDGASTSSRKVAGSCPQPTRTLTQSGRGPREPLATLPAVQRHKGVPGIGDAVVLLADMRTRVAAASSVTKRSIVAASTEAGAICRKLAQRANRDSPLRIWGSLTGARRSAQAGSSLTRAVLSIGIRPHAANAAARSLRRFAQRLAETFACAGTTWSSVWRMAARSSGVAPGGTPASLAKHLTAERRSRRRASDRPSTWARRSRTSWRVTTVPVTGGRFGFHVRVSSWTVKVAGGPKRTGRAIRED